MLTSAGFRTVRTLILPWWLIMSTLAFLVVVCSMVSIVLEPFVPGITSSLLLER